MKRFVFAVALIVCVTTLIPFAVAQNASKKILPTGWIELIPEERTQEQMDADDAAYVPTTPRAIPFRPTIDESLYKQLKEQAGRGPKSARSGAATSSQQAPVAVNAEFAGITQGAGDSWPPDVTGAIGKTQFLAASNFHINGYTRAGVLNCTHTLNGFFGYKTTQMFDPRVQYDAEWQRFVVIADSSPQNANVQILGIAISKTNNACGGYFVYKPNVIPFLTPVGGFFDFPMLGLSQDAIVGTGNSCAPGCGSSSLYAIAKARVYNGLGWGVPVFTGLFATLEPSLQLMGDQSQYSWLAAAPTASGTIQMYALQAPANPPGEALFGPFGVAGVAGYGVPPAAVQPAPCGGGVNAIDTSDNRFVNAGTQNGDLLYQAHTTGDFGLPTPRYYVINGLTTLPLGSALGLAASSDFFSSATSSDFNVSIAANTAGKYVVNWSVVDSSVGINAQQYAAASPINNGIDGTAVLPGSGGNCLTGNFDPRFGDQRWGDYSQVSVDYGTGAISNFGTINFLIDNETIFNTNTWTTQIANVQ